MAQGRPASGQKLGEVGVIAYPADPQPNELGISDPHAEDKPILLKDEKRDFIKKVFGIVMCQLVVTFGITYCGKERAWVIVVASAYPTLGAILGNIFLMILSALMVGVSFFITFMISRKVPWNYVSLGVFVLSWL